MNSEGHFGGQVNQYVRYAINLSRKSVVLESPVTPSLGCQFGSLTWFDKKIQEPLTQGVNWLMVVGLIHYTMNQFLWNLFINLAFNE